MLHRDNSIQFIGKVVRFDCGDYIMILSSAEMIPKPTIKVCILYYKCKFTVNENPQSILTTFPINTMGLQTCMLPGLSWFQFTRGGAIWHITVIPCAFVVCLICTPSALGPAALGLRVYISGKPLMPMV